MLIIGIDPGVHGGVAIIPLYAFRQTQIYALDKYTLSDLCAIFTDIRHGSDDKEPILSDSPLNDMPYRKDTQVEVFLENPKLPGTMSFGVNVHRELGRSVGQMEGLCAAHNWIPELLSPQKWQRGLDCMTGGDKNITKTLAQHCFPFMFSRRSDGTPYSLITDSVADALLIALYGYLHYIPSTKIPNSVRDNIPSECRVKIDKNRRTVKEVKSIRINPDSTLTTEQTLLDLENRNVRKRPFKPQRRP